MKIAFHIALRRERQKRGWTQKQLAQRAGLARTAITDLELARQRPTPQRVQRLAAALAIPVSVLGEPLPRNPVGRPNWMHSDLWRLFGRQRGRYRLDRERESWVRLRAARKECPWLFDQLLRSALVTRPRTEILDFLHYASCDSGIEALGWLHLLASKAVVVSYVALTHLGWCRFPVVDLSGKLVGHRLWPVLVSEPYPCALFPQVRVQTPEVYRLDFLALVRIANRTLELDVEIDGSGHDPASDGRRERALGIRAVRFTREEVASADFLHRLIDRLRVEAEALDAA
ncbi:MAG: helix-turn-helix transcriptional regulator [Candidatus Eremiobacterota bacterium]